MSQDKLWEHDYQLSIHSYYVGEIEAGARSCDRIMNKPSVAENIRFQTQKNICFYMKTLESYDSVKFIKIDVPKFKPNWSLFNPTIINWKSKVYTLVRCSNYDLTKNYATPPEDNGIIMTEWCLAELDENLNVSSYRWMQKPEYQTNNYSVRGIEDCRVFSVDDQLYVSATVCDVHPYSGNPRIAMCSVDLDNARFDNLKILSGINPDRAEKNWMPIQHCSDYPEWLYMCEFNGDTVINSLQGNKNIFCYLNGAPYIGKSFRGGSQLVKYNDGYIAVVHEVAFFENWKRVYYHRIAEFDSSKKMINCSLPFALKQNMAIEFCSGATWKEDNLLITFGVRDIEPWIAVIPKTTIDDMLSKSIMR